MGQRNMTYVITEGSYEGTTINTIYNQWNFVKLQAYKLERVITFLKGLKTASNLFQTVFAAHGLSPESGWVGGYVADKEYKEYNMEPFGEDNNNGWVIIKVKQTGEYGEYKYEIELCCIHGNEDVSNFTCKPVPTAKYFSIEEKGLKDKPEQLEEYRKTVDFVTLNTTYNPNLKKEAVSLIQKHLIKQSNLIAK